MLSVNSSICASLTKIFGKVVKFICVWIFKQIKGFMSLIILKGIVIFLQAKC